MTSTENGEVMKEYFTMVNAFYFFKLKHDIQNDSELRLAKLEVESLLGKHVNEVINIVDLLTEEPFKRIVVKSGKIRPQDYLTRLPYCGRIQGYMAQAHLMDVSSLMRLAYFRDFFILMDFPDIKQCIKIIYPPLARKIKDIRVEGKLNKYNLLPYVQLFTLPGEKTLLLFRFIPFHVLYEYSDFVIRLAKDEEDVNRMFKLGLKHLQEGIYRPYNPSSARRYKWIEDFIDNRWAPNSYLTHSFFGLKGAFFPRMIHAIINIIKLKEKDVVLDPMCGCGTFNVESAIMGIDSIGIDINPLLRLISCVKVQALFEDVSKLKEMIISVLDAIKKSDNKVDRIEINLPKRLLKKVRPESKKTVEMIKKIIEKIPNETHRNFCKVALAYYMKSMLTKYSKEKIISSFEERLWKMYFAVYFLHLLKKHIPEFRIGKAKILQDVIDAKRLPKFKVDAVITSPPYLITIDYVQDNIYSLYALDLIKDHKQLYKQTIGSKKVQLERCSIGQRTLIETPLQKIFQMLEKLQLRYSKPIYKYFLDMEKVFKEIYRVLKPGGYAVIIIGKQVNVLTESGSTTIELAKILQELGESIGFKTEKILDIHLHKTSIGMVGTESLIFFKKPD